MILTLIAAKTVHMMLYHAVTHLYHFIVGLILHLSRLYLLGSHTLLLEFVFIVLFDDCIHTTIVININITFLLRSFIHHVTLRSLIWSNFISLLASVPISTVFLFIIFIRTRREWTGIVLIKVQCVLMIRVLRRIRLYTIIFKLFETVDTFHYYKFKFCNYFFKL